MPAYAGMTGVGVIALSTTSPSLAMRRHSRAGGNPGVPLDTLCGEQLAAQEKTPENTAFPEAFEADGEGFEPTYDSRHKRFSRPLTDLRNPHTSQEVSEPAQLCLADCLAFLQRERPDLATIVEAWDTLPDALKAGIVAMVNAAKG